MSDRNIYTIGWISAVVTEYVAAQGFLHERHEGFPSVNVHDDNSYTLGRIGSHNVVMVCLAEYGTSQATKVATDLFHSFPNIRACLMVGIGGGVPSKKHDIRLGDIVVSRPSSGYGGVFQYDHGKAFQGQDFQPTQFLNEPPQFLRAAAVALEAQHIAHGNGLEARVEEVLLGNLRLRKGFSRPPAASDRLYKSDFVHQNQDGNCSDDEGCGNDISQLINREVRGEYDDNPAIHYGLIASGNQVVKDALFRDKDIAKNVLCFEMEAAGLIKFFPCLVIRGVCDYADSHKNKRWQGYAAMVAAAYAEALLGKITPSRIEAETRIAETLSHIDGMIVEVHQDVKAIKSHNDLVKAEGQILRIQKWLQPPRPSPNPIRARQVRQGGTGTWLLSHPVFQAWRSGLQRHVWLHGLMGSGKTVLSTMVLDQVTEDGENDERLVLSFFFDFSSSENRTKDNMLRALAFDLYRDGQDDSAAVLEASFQAHQNGHQQPTSMVLEDVVKKMLTHRKVIIILDALDESSTRIEVLSWLENIICSSGLEDVQLFCTSRSEHDFLRDLPGLVSKGGCVELDNHVINNDIALYVSEQLSTRREFQRKVFTTDIRERIQRQVGAGANGMFRWAACQLDTLVNLRSPKKVAAALNDLPQDLDETYDRILKSIPEQDKPDTTRLLLFLVHSHMPPTVEEAVEIVATDTDAEPPCFDVHGRISEEDEILQYGLGLISMFPVKRSNGTMGREVRLAHFSVKEFLRKRPDFSQLRASIVITTTCLTYLSDITGSLTDIEHNYPFSRSAADIWTRHGASAEEDEEVFRSIVKFLGDEETFSRWRVLFPEPYYGSALFYYPPRTPPTGSSLYYACMCGFARVSQALVAKGADVNVQGGSYVSPLAAASAKGHLEIVKILLDNGADVNAHGGTVGSALQAAIDSGYEDIVRTLLEMSADVNTPYYNRSGSIDGSVLLYALAKGQDTMAKVLLEMKADVTARGNEFGNALCAASLAGLVDLMAFFLDKAKANVNAQGGFYGNALQAASAGGHLEGVELLLEKGADVNAQGGYFGNALQTASVRGHLEAMELLLKKGADVNALGGFYGNALQAASLQGPLEGVELLLKKGADVNIQGGYLGNALTAATSKNRVELVRTLVDMGADCNAQGGEPWRSPLRMAARIGSIELMELFLTRGADVNARHEQYGTALLAATLGKHVEAARFLVQRGADIHMQSNGNGSPLHAAASKGSIELMEIFLEQGADINARGGEYDSALQAAAWGLHAEAVKLLVEKGADVHQQGGKFGNPLAAALAGAKWFENGNNLTETVNFLRQAMAATEDKSKEPSDQGC